MIQRLIAQGVLLAMLTGMFAPLATAAALPHACCLRHQQHCRMPHDAGFSSRSCCHQCCRFLAVFTALFTPAPAASHRGLLASALVVSDLPTPRPHPAMLGRPQRAPPHAS
ncbi:MAG TPA: hypothetical protein VKT29_11065 [Terriglobales bacterium]|nr:hypothetical protein [Terriglobales bacterium]